ncbi:MAG: short chain dehydrogenase [bacterium]|nr:short chain dehydrogenase [bacterium]
MQILLIGGNGTIGKTVAEKLRQKHEVIIAGRSNGDVIVDIEDVHTIHTAYKKYPDLDAVVCIAGEARWAPLTEMTNEDFYIGIRSKLMGQVNLVRLGLQYLKQGGSFTLTTGVLADDPVDKTTSAAMVNGALHSFVKAAALEIDQDRRINVVAAGLVEDAAEKYEDYFPGHNPVPMDKVVNGYLKSILGKVNGQIIRVLE